MVGLPGQIGIHNGSIIYFTVITCNIIDYRKKDHILWVMSASTGASTDSQGNFELTVENLQDTLVVSYIGYQTIEVPIAGRSEVNIQLTTRSDMAEEML